MRNEVSYQLKDARGKLVDLSNLSSVWWRRYSGKQLVNKSETEESKLANTSFKSVFVGMLTSQDCNFVSHPAASTSASNKIFQLNSAISTFSFVPSTIATNSLQEVHKYFDGSSQIIIKPLEHADNRLIFTRTTDIENIDQNELSKCPILVQEKIHAARHFRVNLFGENTLSYAIESPDLDWREDLKNAKIYEIDLDKKLISECVDLLRKLDLTMGIFDFIEDKNGDVYFIEVNPQGQFLFLQPYGKTSISTFFCEFLTDESNSKES